MKKQTWEKEFDEKFNYDKSRYAPAIEIVTWTMEDIKTFIQRMREEELKEIVKELEKMSVLMKSMLEESSKEASHVPTNPQEVDKFLKRRDALSLADVTLKEAISIIKKRMK